MIADRPIASKEAFETLLEKARQNLETTIEIGESMSNQGFETAVLKALKKAAKGTSFEGQISKTEDRAFPDIVVQEHYGVEVKKTTKDNFRAAGNSIFESARAPEVKVIYIMMASASGVRWKLHDDSIYNIVVTHGPRYAIDLDSEENVFEKMDITPGNFRKLDQQGKIERIKTLYADRTLWWLSTSEGLHYRFWSDLSEAEKNDLRAEILFVCPSVFSETIEKFKAAPVYALGRGIIIPYFRDILTSGGKIEHQGRKHPRIYGHLKALLPAIRTLADGGIDKEVLTTFWPQPPEDDGKKRFEQWKNMAREKIEDEEDRTLFDSLCL